VRRDSIRSPHFGESDSTPHTFFTYSKKPFTTFDDPEGFNLTNIKTACVTPNIAPFTCKPVDEYLFWDGIHPTKAGHALLSREAAIVLQ
jgi:hypothetical protein